MMNVTVCNCHPPLDDAPEVVDIEDFVEEHAIKLRVTVERTPYAVTLYTVMLEGLNCVAEPYEPPVVGRGFTLDAALMSLAVNVCGNHLCPRYHFGGRKYFTGPYLGFSSKFVRELRRVVSNTPTATTCCYTLL